MDWNDSSLELQTIPSWIDNPLVCRSSYILGFVAESPDDLAKRPSSATQTRLTELLYLFLSFSFKGVVILSLFLQRGFVEGGSIIVMEEAGQGMELYAQ